MRIFYSRDAYAGYSPRLKFDVPNAASDALCRRLSEEQSARKNRNASTASSNLKLESI